MWMNEIMPLPSFERLPTPEFVCPCSTEILNHYLIQHIVKKTLHLVGCECIKRFGDLRRKCVACLKPNRCHTVYCKDCRRKCQIHDVYHDDNAVHTHRPPPPKISVRSVIMRSPIQSIDLIKPARITAKSYLILDFGQYKGKHISEVHDDSYIQWVVSQDFLNEELRDHIIDKYLPNTVYSFGKYKGSKLCDIDDQSYIEWCIQNTRHKYLQHFKKKSF